MRRDHTRVHARRVANPFHLADRAVKTIDFSLIW